MKRKLNIIFALLAMTLLCSSCGGSSDSNLTTGSNLSSALPQPNVDCGGNPCIE